MKKILTQLPIACWLLSIANWLLPIASLSQSVGIGTTNPAFKLDVRNGSINVDSVYRIGTTTVLAVLGTENLFVGKGAGTNNTGSYNTFSGNRAGYFNTSGIYNSFFGQGAGSSNTTGIFNSFFGSGAGNANTTGIGNAFFGISVGGSNTEGENNSFFGRGAGSGNITGIINTAVGYSTRFSTGALSNSTVIGSGATVDASNKVRIGNIFVTSIGGQVGWSTFSDGRFKQQVQEDVQGLAFIKKLHTISYLVDLTALNNYYLAGNSEIDKSSSSQENTNIPTPEIVRQSGFIAQEVEQVANELGFSFSGIDKPKNEKALYGLRYSDFVVPLVKAVQEQQIIIETLQKQVEAARVEIPIQIGKQQAIIEQQTKMIDLLVKEIKLIKEKLR